MKHFLSMVLLAGASAAELFSRCLPSTRVACVNNYAAAIADPFFRPPSTDLEHTYDFTDIVIAGDESTKILNDSDFLVFDQERGLEILGSPSYELLWNDTAQLEGTTYVPRQNKIYAMRLFETEPSQISFYQLVVDLNKDPPTVNKYFTDPPIVQADGGSYHNGSLYVAVCGSTDNSTRGGPSHSGIRAIDIETGKSTVLLNNYFGSPWGCIDDLVVHPGTGDIFFSNNDYGWASGGYDFAISAPELPNAIYRFTPSTGAVRVVDDTLKEPNGLAFSPDYKIMYISDTGSVSPGPVDPVAGMSSQQYMSTGHRTIYSYDVSQDTERLTNKRAFYLTQDLVPDALRVAANGYILCSAGNGVDVVDTQGVLLVRIKTDFLVVSFTFGGRNMDELWLTGSKIVRVKWNLTGVVH